MKNSDSYNRISAECPANGIKYKLNTKKMAHSGNCHSERSEKFIKITSSSFKFLILFFIFFTSFSASRTGQGTVDTVYNYMQGIVEDSLSNNPYYPQNIFGIPSRKATRTIPANSREDVEAIGFGGEIILGFKDKVLHNGPGTDFIIFENAFVNPVNNGIFAEPGIVSVSKDGINFFDFPYDKTTLKGLAGLTPTFGDKDPYNPVVSGGDAFDLDVLGLDYIKYIKIRDTTRIVTSLPNSHKYWNPEFILTGFDLDAVAGLYLEDESTSVGNNFEVPVKFIFNKNILSIESDFKENFEVNIFNLSGERIYNSFSENHLIKTGNFICGIYIAEAVIGRKKFVYKFICN